VSVVPLAFASFTSKFFVLPFSGSASSFEALAVSDSFVFASLPGVSYLQSECHAIFGCLR
jgi:hypothetical protein